MQPTNATRPMTLQTALDELIAARPDSYISVSSEVHRWSGSQWEVDFKIYDAKADNGTSEIYEAHTLEAAMLAWRQANFPANVSDTTEAAAVFADAEALATPEPVGDVTIPEWVEAVPVVDAISECEWNGDATMAWTYLCWYPDHKETRPTEQCRIDHPEKIKLDIPF